MLTVIIKNDGEENVVKLTYENLWKELKHIPDAELVVSDNWFDALDKAKTKFVCLVESDCLVNSGYFDSMVGHLRKNPQLGKLGVLSSATAVNNWAVRFFGYHLGDNYSDGVIPNRDKKDTKLPFYTSQIAYIPGAVIRTGMFKTILKDIDAANSWEKDLVYMSTMISLGFWRHSWMVYIAPNSTYCTTEDYVNDIGKFDSGAGVLAQKFAKESI